MKPGVQEAVEVLREVISLVHRPGTDVAYSRYDNVEAAVADLTAHLDRVMNGDTSKLASSASGSATALTLRPSARAWRRAYRAAEVVFEHLAARRRRECRHDRPSDFDLAWRVRQHLPVLGRTLPPVPPPQFVQHWNFQCRLQPPPRRLHGLGVHAQASRPATGSPAPGSAAIPARSIAAPAPS